MFAISFTAFSGNLYFLQLHIPFLKNELEYKCRQGFLLVLFLYFCHQRNQQVQVSDSETSSCFSSSQKRPNVFHFGPWHLKSIVFSLDFHKIISISFFTSWLHGFCLEQHSLPIQPITTTATLSHNYPIAALFSSVFYPKCHLFIHFFVYYLFIVQFPCLHVSSLGAHFMSWEYTTDC